MDDRVILQELAQDSRSWVSNRASMALQLADQYAGGGLDDLEYSELMERIVDSSSLDQQADDLLVKTTLVTAVLGLGNII